MAQVTIYLDDETAELMRKSAKSAGLSMSAWLAQLVREKTASTWPADVRELAGAWADDEIPMAEQLPESHFCGISTTTIQVVDPRVATRTILESLGHLPKQFGYHLTLVQVGSCLTTRVQISPLG